MTKFQFFRRTAQTQEVAIATTPATPNASQPVIERELPASYGGAEATEFNSAPLHKAGVNEAGVNETCVNETVGSAPSEIESLQLFADESNLVSKARNDPTAFGELYQRYVDRIYAYIYHRVGNEQDAEDLTARTFYRALDKFETYEDRGLPFGAWLFRIAHNLVANWHRDHSRRSFISLDRLWSVWREDDDPVQNIEQNEQNDALWDAINRLPGERRDLLLYKFSSRLSNLEIGELMNKSESAIKSLYFRTLASLREDLEERGWGK